MTAATVRIAAAFAVLLAVGSLTACAGSQAHRATGAAQSSEAADHNAADIAFATNMVAHHGQAVQMAQMVPTNTTNQQVIALANQITATQLPEMQAFRAWLMQWQDVGGSGSVRGRESNADDRHGRPSHRGQVANTHRRRFRQVVADVDDRPSPRRDRDGARRDSRTDATPTFCIWRGRSSPRNSPKSIR